MSAAQNAGLQRHNEHRSKHEGTPPMTLNRQLCSDAQSYADQIARAQQLKHAPASQRQGCGENLAYFGGWNRNPANTDDVLMSKSCDNWYNEITDYNFQTGEKLPGRNPQTGKPRGAVGHFTQLVWKTSTELGVGIAHNGDKTYVVARYKPAGNYVGQSLQFVGRLQAGGARPTPAPAPTPTPNPTPSPSSGGRTTIPQTESKMRLSVLAKLICELCKELGVDPKQEILNARTRAAAGGGLVRGGGECNNSNCSDPTCNGNNCNDNFLVQAGGNCNNQNCNDPNCTGENCNDNCNNPNCNDANCTGCNDNCSNENCNDPNCNGQNCNDNCNNPSCNDPNCNGMNCGDSVLVQAGGDCNNANCNDPSCNGENCKDNCNNPNCSDPNCSGENCNDNCNNPNCSDPNCSGENCNDNCSNPSCNDPNCNGVNCDSYDNNDNNWQNSQNY